MYGCGLAGRVGIGLPTAPARRQALEKSHCLQRDDTCALCASLPRGLAARLGAGANAKWFWGRPTVPNAVGAACVGFEGARASGNEQFSPPASTRRCCWLSACACSSSLLLSAGHSNIYTYVCTGWDAQGGSPESQVISIPEGCCWASALHQSPVPYQFSSVVGAGGPAGVAAGGENSGALQVGKERASHSLPGEPGNISGS